MSPTTSLEWIFTNVRHVRVGAAQKNVFLNLYIPLKPEQIPLKPQGSKLIYEHPSRGLSGQSPRMNYCAFA